MDSVAAWFPFVAAGHPFYPQLAEFLAAVQASSAWTALDGRLHAGQAYEIHAEIKGVPDPVKGWALDRFYWSLQFPEPASPYGFYAWTLHYAAKTGTVQSFEFPNEPYLVSMGSYLQSLDPEARQSLRILRYVPLRRVTFRGAIPSLGAAPVIGKFKRRSRYQEGFSRLQQINSADRAGSNIRFPSPLHLDDEHALFFQEFLAGRSLVDLLDSENASDLLSSLAKLHHTLHGMQLAELPRWEPDKLIRDAQLNLSWIGFFFPDCDALLKQVGEHIERKRPKIEASDLRFCHGDFVCSQILVGEESWGVVDFDLATFADPYFELAMLPCSFEYDLPDLMRTAPRAMEAAASRYLEAYTEKMERSLDRARLQWYQLIAEVYYLALMLKKNRFRAEAFERGLNQIQTLIGSQ